MRQAVKKKAQARKARRANARPKRDRKGPPAERQERKGRATHSYCRWLLHAIGRNPGQFLRITGVMSVKVGHDPEDEFTIRFGDDQRPVHKGLDQNANLVVWFTDEAFDGFLDGTLDAGAALDSEELRLGGDITLLSHLGRITREPMNLLSIRGGR